MTTVTISIHDYERFKGQETILKNIKSIDDEQEKKRERINEDNKIIDARYQELKDMEDKIIKNETVIICNKEIDLHTYAYFGNSYSPKFKYELPSNFENHIINNRKEELIKTAKQQAQEEIEKIKKLSFWERVFYKE